MIVCCYYSKDSIVELKNNQKILLKDLNSGDLIKCADNNFNYQNRNIVYRKITDIFSKSYDNTWKIYTRKGNTIIGALSSSLKTTVDNEIQYFSHKFGEIFDDYEGFDGIKHHHFILYNHFDELEKFEPNGKDELIGFNIEGNNSVFINDFLVG